MSVLHDITVKCLAGCEEILQEEMIRLGAAETRTGNRVVFAKADMDWVYRANLCLRTAMRILLPFRKFRAKNPEVLYHKCKKVRWEDIFGLDQTFAIDATVHSSLFPHSRYAALKVKDAIVDQFRLRTGERPNVDPRNPDYRFDLHVEEDQCTLSLDTSGKSLHLRGYKVRQGEAPVSEVLAASILILSGWEPGAPLLNPMCGSGTFLTEAALMGLNRPPHMNLDFGFKRWTDYDSGAWSRALEYARDHMHERPLDITGFDRDQKAVHAATMNIDAAGLTGRIRVEKQDFFAWEPEIENGHVLINPPYDERLRENDIEQLYKEIGDTLKQHYAGNTIWIFTGNRAAAKRIGLRTSMKKPLWNGPIECRLLKFDMYRGSKDHD